MKEHQVNLLSFKKSVLGVWVLLAPMSGFAQKTVTTTGGTTGYVPRFSGAATVVNSQIFDTGTAVGVGGVPNSSVKLDVNGAMIMRGNMQVTRTGNATSAKGNPSWGFQFYSNAYNSSTKAGDNPYFQLQSEPTGNNTASPSATFNLLFSNNGAAAAETGLYINPNGTLHFASAQTFPIAAGPQGPAGPTGPVGPQGPAGTLALPYARTLDGAGSPLFSMTNGGSSGGGGVVATGSQSVAVAGHTAGSGVVGVGGASDANLATYGGTGTLGYGGDALSSQAQGGVGGYFEGGYAQAGGAGGDGIKAYAGGSTVSGLGGVAVYANANGSGEYAGLFYGAVEVEGNLSKSGGSFKIDDPVDPGNKYLYHSFVESPDMKNIYDGNVVTDGRGEAVVTMPEYFEALNRDFRYQLTVIGQFAQAIVGSEIANGSFVIKTDRPGVKVSWQVTGIRQDAWANAHRIPLEEEKPEKEKGHFLHPELFGHAGEPSISEMGHPRAQAVAAQ
jgi:hypothetical protein